MTKGNIDKESIINKAVELVNSVGIDKVTLKMLAENLGIKSPSLYNHIDGVDDLKMQLMMYGWKQAEERITQAVIGLS
ncbi:TetR family transcriptional regulator, partial [Desulfovibrio desulfuricans]|nr:TetR family transcriptional regulator [Desulfovibrio desulfuricans]